ncbi:MAG: hypothetical protein GY855_18070, partial [candidate division Zixibacteria bacterium]|nr:hypothetical protein [candidate division Zixibacteria bacterium]
MNRRLPLGFRNILLTGTEYIIIGVLLGAMGLDIIDSQTRGQLQPFILFGLSCIGFLYGLQFELKQLRTLPRFYLSISAIQACITAAVVSIGIYMIF